MASSTIVLLDREQRGVHYRDLCKAFDAVWIDPDRVPDSDTLCRADLCIVSDEYYWHNTLTMLDLARHGVPTLHIADGVVEWRNTWENPRSQTADQGMPLFQPVLAHKIACISRSQTRILESWGNLGKCEVVGVPRFDSLLGRQPRARSLQGPFRLLIMTAKTPGFTPAQIDRVSQSLCDLRAALAAPVFDQPRIEPVWRVTGGLADEIGIPNTLRDTTGADLAEVLPTVDAVITTPSTSMLEGMLQGVPVALLDYNNCPHYVPAAWRITAREHLLEVLRELLAPPATKMLYQQTILHDNLECHSPATPRMVQLVEAMVRRGQDCRARGEPLSFPRRMLPDKQDGHHLPEADFDLARLYPDHPVFGNMDRTRLQVELGHLRVAFQSQSVLHKAEIAGLQAEIARLRTVAQTQRARLERIETHPLLGTLLRLRRRILRLPHATDSPD